ncbi:SpoIIE family protein phosphatase [Trichlorobacter ammonificans]|uniref:Phytochrome sensor protein n=1 Tax=Trichlorobacter ammonificans TaxID=2916410 RepID=A0ABM9D7B1_9BACT|nr:SpoIIE family protein phosphatase [Trichlorobacter ammonificans]CAH2031066.1 Putative phytochrome sensor protein [Trichlorobacter ammonificans]
MTLNILHVAAIAIAYTGLLFLVAWHARRRSEQGRSVINSPLVYSLSIAVYCTSWTFFGSVGKAATTGIDFVLIYLGPTLVAFSWFFLLRRIIRISKESNISSIADFISLRYGKSQLLGSLVTLIAVLGIMPYIALQIKAVSTSFALVSGVTGRSIPLPGTEAPFPLPTGLILTLVLAIFGVIFGARTLSSTARHEGLIAAVAFESVVKLLSLMGVGIFVTFYLFNGFEDIFTRFYRHDPDQFYRLFTLETGEGAAGIPASTMLMLSMGAVMLLPRQFHVMVVENADLKHVKKAMWLFPVYLFLINIFIMPIALGGILLTGSSQGADYFVITLPLNAGNEPMALLAFLGGLSAAAGMVMVESVAISTMLLNNLFMPLIVRVSPKPWFPVLLINLKRFAIFLVVFLGYFYYRVVGDSFMLVNMGLISFSAAMQFMPALLGGLYWRRGNKTGAICGMLLGFLAWGYTLLLPSFITAVGDPTILLKGPGGLSLLRPTALFGLSGMDMWSHSLFWSMLFNIGGYLVCSLTFRQTEAEREQVRRFINRFEIEQLEVRSSAKRLSKPVSVQQFVALMGKFIGQHEARKAMGAYLKGRMIDEAESVPEFELPAMKRFVERTLAGSVGAAAAGAIMDSYLSDMGSRMESVYDIFSTVRASLSQSREALYVRLKASEIINRTLDLQTIMDELLQLLLKEFRLDCALIQIRTSSDHPLQVQSYQGTNRHPIGPGHWYLESEPYARMAMVDQKAHFVNDINLLNGIVQMEATRAEGFVSFAHIPIFREGEESLGVLSVYSKSIVGLFTEEFISLLSSLSGQLAQSARLVSVMEAKEKERREKELAQLANARVMRDMEIAEQIQNSLLPAAAPELFGIDLAGRCASAAHVGGDYYDFFKRDDQTIDLLIADVSGHSVGAALIMAEVRTLLRVRTGRVASPSVILGDLNNQLYEDLTRAELFISMFYARYNAATGRLSYANAGHNLPILYRDSEARCIELDADGMVLGIKPSIVFEEQSLELQSGDLLLLYTDGIPEAASPDGEFLGMERVYRHLAAVSALPANAIVDSFYDMVKEYCGSSTLQDDVSLVALKITA